MPELVERYKNGDLKIDEYITHEMKFPEINEAFEVLARGEVARSVVIYD